MSRHYQEILKELHEETHRDGYFGRKLALEQIVDELVLELQYVNKERLNMPDSGHGDYPFTASTGKGRR